MVKEIKNMPVITLYFEKIFSLLKGKCSSQDLVEKIPYLGLTLEKVTKDYIKLEYNPNRPDYSTSFGIARGLNGLMGFELGEPTYRMSKGNVKIIVDNSTKEVRPIVVGLVAKNLKMDDEIIEEIISMQEDLHDGIGRNRRKVSIGIHNLDAVKPPIIYTTKKPIFKFIPLGEKNPMSMTDILKKMDVGKEYGYIVSQFDRFPILLDSLDNIISFPPIINGKLTRLTPSTMNIFIDVTATNQKAAEDVLAIITTALYDAGAKIETVEISTAERLMMTPNLESHKMEVDLNLANKMLGLSFTEEEIFNFLRKSRISRYEKKGKTIASIPRYRVDILHQVDLVEEIAYGFGFEKFTPKLPTSKNVGRLNKVLSFTDSIREIMIGLGFVEVMNYKLSSKKVLYDLIDREPKNIVRVENPKSIEFKFLRDIIFPSLLLVLSKNLHEEFPQRIFEISRVIKDVGKRSTKITEDFHLAAAIAHSSANYTEAKSNLVSLLSQSLNIDAKTIPSHHHTFIQGRVASIECKSKVGVVGEINPKVLEGFELRTPVSIFEINLSMLLKQL
jgi:phenylalanyl-tRNA synthetase beta chain